MSVVHLPVGPAQSNNPFRFFWDLGWQGVIPLLPVAATPDPSWAAKRGDAIAYGKMPAIKQPNGTWLPFSGWGTRETAESDLDRWNAWGANVGFRLPKDWLVFDIDILEKKWADIAESIVTEHLGEAPCRVGQAPKRMLFYRLTEPSKGGWVYGETENGTERIEIFTHGRNTVLAGTHPKTNAPFQWPRAPIPADKLPRVTPDQLEAVWQALVDALPEGSRTAAGSAADRETISQRSLAGDLETVTRAVQSMPNNRDIYPERDSYIKIGAAIKAALPDDEHEAFDLWCEWAAKDNGGTPELWEKDWRGLGDTFAVGAAWLYAEAERVSGGKFTAAQAHFEPVNDISEPSPFDIQAQHEREENNEPDYELLTISQISSRPPPTFLLDQYIPDVSTGFLYSAPGVGKSFLALDIGLHIAHRRSDWHGVPLTTQEDAAVIYIASEGSFDLKNRIAAWHKHHDLDPANAEASFRVIEQTIDFMRPEDINRLISSVRKANLKPTITFVDTVSRAMPGADENLQKEMTLFVRACDHVKETFRCAVVGVHHAGKSGDLRGSTVLRGAGDFVMKMERKKGASVATLTMEKQKAAPDGWDAQIAMNRIDLGEKQSSLVPTMLTTTAGGADLNQATASVVLEAMRAAWEAGEPWSRAHQAKERFAVRRMVADFGFKADEAETALKMWEAAGIIQEELRDSKRKRQGYKVHRDVKPPAEQPETQAFG